MAVQLCRCSLAKKSRNATAGVMLCWKGWKWVLEVGVGRSAAGELFVVVAEEPSTITKNVGTQA